MLLTIWAAAELELMLVRVEDGTLLPDTCCYYLLKECIEVVEGILPVSSFLLIRLSVFVVSPLLPAPVLLAEAAAGPPTPVPFTKPSPPAFFLKLPRRPRGSFRILRSTVKTKMQ